MKLSLLLTALACFALAQAPLPAQQTQSTPNSGVTIPPEDPDPINDTDTDFIKTTSQGLRFEVLAGQLARSHAAHSAVREFGKWMKRDHSADFTALVALAKEEGVALPPGLSDEQTRELQKLQGLWNEAFDREYIGFEIGDHQMDIHDFTEEVRNGEDFDVQRYAANSITELLEHLAMAQEIGAMLHVSTH
jgi:putative membrane protein